jgi:hypothetical protein
MRDIIAPVAAVEPQIAPKMALTTWQALASRLFVADQLLEAVEQVAPIPDSVASSPMRG